MDKAITAKSYTIKTESGNWLAQIVLTSDGMISGVTDYGNFANAWRSGGDDFREFIIGLNVGYFTTKISGSFSYMFGISKKNDRACALLCEKILPPLQKMLREELESEKSTTEEVVK